MGAMALGAGGTAPDWVSPGASHACDTNTLGEAGVWEVWEVLQTVLAGPSEAASIIVAHDLAGLVDVVGSPHGAQFGHAIAVGRWLTGGLRSTLTQLALTPLPR